MVWKKSPFKCCHLAGEISYLERHAYENAFSTVPTSYLNINQKHWFQYDRLCRELARDHCPPGGWHELRDSTVLPRRVQPQVLKLK